MKRRSTLLVDLVIYISIFPLVICVMLMTTLGTTLILNLVPRFSEATSPPTATGRTYRRAVLPTARPTAVQISNLAIPTSQIAGASAGIQEQMVAFVDPPAPAIVPDPSSRVVSADSVVPTQLYPQAQTRLVTTSYSSTDLPGFNSAARDSANAIDPHLLPAASPTFDLDMSVFSGESSGVFAPTRRQRSTSTPEGDVTGLVQNLMSTFGLSNRSPTRSYTPLPTLTPTPTSTVTSTPTPTPTSTGTATPTETPVPTQTPTPTITTIPTDNPLPTATPKPPPSPPPTATLPPTATPLPEYDYMLAEFYNSSTTNSFLLAYVAIVDSKEIPIGDMKIVGTRLDHNLTYESPLSTWYYEGYSAPGEVIKSGNVKFEPPGGIETTSWVLHLEDAHGNRQSDDIPFNVDENNKQWYFIKFRRKY